MTELAELALEVEPLGEKTAQCDCCGKTSRTIWGAVHLGDATIATYFVAWTIAASLKNHPANFDLVLGKWGEGSDSGDRVAVSLINFENENGPGIMVVDAASRAAASADLAARRLSREEVVDTPLAAQAFGVVDAIFLGDHRLYREEEGILHRLWRKASSRLGS